MFSIQLKKLRKSKSFSQAKLAELSALSQAYISELESGEKQPTLKVIKKLAKALEVPILKLLEDNNLDPTGTD